jgi:hypothetical protein
MTNQETDIVDRMIAKTGTLVKISTDHLRYRLKEDPDKFRTLIIEAMRELIHTEKGFVLGEKLQEFFFEEVVD